MACFNQRTTAYLIMIDKLGDKPQRVFFRDGLIYLSQDKDHAEEEAARLKANGETSRIIEVQGPPGMNFKEMQLEMTRTYKRDVGGPFD